MKESNAMMLITAVENTLRYADMREVWRHKDDGGIVVVEVVDDAVISAAAPLEYRAIDEAVDAVNLDDSLAAVIVRMRSEYAVVWRQDAVLCAVCGGRPHYCTCTDESGKVLVPYILRAVEGTAL